MNKNNKLFAVLIGCVPVLLVLAIIISSIWGPFGGNKEEEKDTVEASDNQGKSSDKEGYFTEDLADYTNTLSPKEEEESNEDPIFFANAPFLYVDKGMPPESISMLKAYFDWYHQRLHGETPTPWTVVFDEDSYGESDEYIWFEAYVEEIDLNIEIGYSKSSGGYEFSLDKYNDIANDDNLTIPE